MRFRCREGMEESRLWARLLSLWRHCRIVREAALDGLVDGRRWVRRAPREGCLERPRRRGLIFATSLRLTILGRMLWRAFESDSDARRM